MSLTVRKIPTRKHQIRRRHLMETRVIPDFPEIVIITGPAGSGKTNCTAFMLEEEMMFGRSYELMQTHDIKGDLLKHLKKKPFFDTVILLTGSTDDMYDQLKEDGIINITKLHPTKAHVQQIIDQQIKNVQEADGDITRVPKVLVICDDIMGVKKLVNSDEFKLLATSNRHLNCSVWYLAQFINMVPKVIREQASTVMCFRPSEQCAELLCEQFRERGMTKKEFLQILYDCTVNHSTEEKNFLYIDKKAAPQHRYRKNFDQMAGTVLQPPASIETSADEVKDSYREYKKKEVESAAPLPVNLMGESLVAPSIVLHSEQKEKKKMVIGPGGRRMFV